MVEVLTALDVFVAPVCESDAEDDDGIDVAAFERREVVYEPKPLLLELLSFNLSSLLEWLLELVVEVFELPVLLLLLKLLIGGADTGRPIEFNDWLEEETIINDKRVQVVDEFLTNLWYFFFCFAYSCY